MKRDFRRLVVTICKCGLGLCLATGCMLSVHIDDLNAEPVPAFDPDKLLSTSTHVAVVEVLSDEVLVHDQALGQGFHGSHVRLAVRRNLRGDLRDTLDLRLRNLYRPFGGGWPLRRGTTLIAFLRMSPEGSWQLSDPYYGLVRVSAEKVTGDVGVSIMEAISLELRNGLEDPDPNVVVTALDALAAFRDYEGIEKAATLSLSTNPTIAAHALVYRFAMGDAGGLEQAIALIEEDSGLLDQEKAQVAWALAATEAHVPVLALNRIMLSSNSQILRRAVAAALAERGDSSSLQALASALFSDDRETQYRAIIGLCRITGRAGPGYNDFFSDPDAAVVEWKEWWERQMNRQ